MKNGPSSHKWTLPLQLAVGHWTLAVDGPYQATFVNNPTENTKSRIIFSTNDFTIS
jgi:hypothetical protein